MELDRWSGLLVALLPGLAWLWFFRRKDDHEPEPRLLLYKLFVLGVASAAFVVWFRPRYEAFVLRNAPVSEAVADAFLVTALLEEFAKSAVLVLAVWRRPEFDEPLDAILYAVAVALGFATAENTIYLWITGNPGLLIARSFTSTLAHVAFTGAIGVGLGAARFGRPSWRRWAFPAAFGVSVLAHGAFDWLLLDGSASGVVALLVVLPVALGVLALSVRRTRRLSPLYHPSPVDEDDGQVSASRSVSR